MDRLTAQFLDHAISEGGSGNSSIVGHLEAAFADLVGAEFALCTSSGTSALICALWAAGVRPGDDVAVSPLGPAMTGLAITAIGARPVFLDVADDMSFGIGSHPATKRAASRVKAVVLVPMWGYWDERPETLDLFHQHDIPIIVDAAQAPFLRLSGGLCGVADVVCLSLHGRKPFKAGEGGVCLTNSQPLAEAILQMRNFGQEAAVDGRRLTPQGPFAAHHGANFKMNGLGAAWCLAQVGASDEIRARFTRGRAAAIQSLTAPGTAWLEPTQSPDVTEHGRYGLVAVCADTSAARQLTTALESAEIAVDTSLYRYQPMYTAPVFAPYATACPAAEHLSSRTVACRLEQFAAAPAASMTDRQPASLDSRERTPS